MAGFGLKPEDYVEPTVEVWAENWPVIQLYSSISTQWRVGAGGAFGLDYNVVFHELDRRGLSPEEYDDMMEMIRVVESAALDHFHKD